MALKNKYFNPKTYYYKVIVLCILMCLDILLNSFTQFLDFGSINVITEYNLTDYQKDPGNLSFIFFAIQFLVQLAMIFTLLSIFSQTFFFKHGLLRISCSQFKLTFLIIFIYPIILIVERAIRIMLVSSADTKSNEITIWSTSYYLAIYVIKFLIAFFFYIMTLNSAYELGKSKYYRADPMFGIRLS